MLYLYMFLFQSENKITFDLKGERVDSPLYNCHILNVSRIIVTISHPRVLAPFFRH